jgi:hypothetical protein
MKRWSFLVGAVALAASAYVSAASAAPIPGAHYESGTWTSADYVFFGTTQGGPGLTGLGCPFVPHDDGVTEAETAHLTAAHKGWYGPQIDDTFFQQVLIRTKLTGTVEDAAGNTYRIRGHFLDNSTQEIAGDLQFDGPGKMTLSGPAGTISGTADFRYLIGPFEWDFTFSSITRCDLN